MKKKTIIFATGNEGKMREIHEILADMPYEIISMKDAGIDINIEENGATFEENALIKARAVYMAAGGGVYVMADDSGLEVDAMGGEPGVYSARFMGEDTSYDIKNAEIIKRVNEFEDGTKRAARFRCVIALVYPDGTSRTVDGRFEGEIAYEPAGENGFGYDPIFYVPEFGVTSAQMSSEEKNSMSHRGLALKKIRKYL